MSKSNVTQLHQIYQIKIILEDIRPPVWRRLLVDNHIPLGRLHEAIQISFNWQFAHLHQFIEGSTLYGEAGASDFGIDIIDEDTVALSSILKKEKSWMRYEYDFGDSWVHKIVLEKILPGTMKDTPVKCIKGRRNVPPEDCGGIMGYQHFLEVLANPQHEDYQDIVEWVGKDWDSEYYDQDKINEELNVFFQDKKIKLKRAGDKSEETAMINDMEMMESIPPELEELFGDPEIPTEAKHMLGEILNIMSEINHLNELLDDAEIAFEKIIKMTTDKKVSRIAKEMLKRLE